MTGRVRTRVRGALALAATLLLAHPAPAPAHEVPANVTVRMLVRPDGDRLRVLLRVPVEALRDVDLPRRGPEGWLDVDAARPRLADAARLWLLGYLELREDGRPLADPELAALRVSAPGETLPQAWERAVAHVTGPPLPATAELAQEAALLDVLLDYPIRSTRSDFAVEPGLAHLGVRTTTVLRYWTPDGTERVLQYVGDPGLVRLDPSWHHAVRRFVVLGFEHILGGIDHLLFLLALVVPFRRIGPLVPVVTAFTVAHSITLGAAALGFVPEPAWFPALVETLIAASVVWMAVENVVGASPRRRWLVAFAFGLVHGFGFSFLLSESLQLAGGHALTALLAFNAGVELGQLAVLVVAVPGLALVARGVARMRASGVPASAEDVPQGARGPGDAVAAASGPSDPWLDARRITAIVVSVLVGHTAWHWMTARGADLMAYDVRLPALDLFLLADAMRWGALALLTVGAAWLTGAAFRRLDGPWTGLRDDAGPFEGGAAPEPGPGW